MDPMFPVLFTIAKIWKESKCSLTDEWIKKIHTHTHTHTHTRIHQNEISPFVTTWMDIEGIMLSEIRPREKGTKCKKQSK